jgi:hypothetical protein
LNFSPSTQTVPSKDSLACGKQKRVQYVIDSKNGKFRLELAGERFRDQSYGGDLDQLVAMLDNMTERRVVPGRVYTPSTLHDREGLLLPMLAILLAAMPETGDDDLRKRIEGLAEHEDALPDGDRSLRNVLHQLRRLSTALDKPDPRLRRTVSALRVDPDLETLTTSLRAIVGDAVSTIEAQRLERLKRRPVDPVKLERIRASVEAAIMEPPAGILYFRGFSIGTWSGRPASRRKRFRCSFRGIGKGALVAPPMETESANLIEVLAERFRQHAADQVWGRLRSRSRDKVAVAARLDEDSFWRAVREIAGRVGPYPILLLSRQGAARITNRFLHRVQSDKPALKIERNPSDDRGGFYIATVEGIDVYGADINPGAAWLFSALLLRAVKYAVVDDEGRRVELTFEPTEDTKGALHMEYVQTTAWARYPVLEIGLLP